MTDEDGNIIGTVGAMRDITQRKERELDLERKNEQLDEFVSIVSHDLQNPLNVAQGRLELARQRHDGDGLDAVARAHRRMGALIDDLLELARTGAAAPDIQSLQFADVIDDTWLESDTEEVTTDIETDRSIRAGRSQLKLLLTNLIGNAIEHSGPGVTVTIGECPGGFFVGDDGPGIPENERDRIFDSGYTTKPDGTGFGLNVVKQVVNAHNWDVSVLESADGGARFEFTGVEMGH